MSRRAKPVRSAVAPIAFTPELRALFRLVDEEWPFLGGRIWRSAKGLTLVARFRDQAGHVVRARVRIECDAVVDESLTITLGGRP